MMSSRPPHIQALFRLLRHLGIRVPELAQRSGISQNTIYGWNRGGAGGETKAAVAGMENVRAAANAVGYEFLLVPKDWLAENQFIATDVAALSEILKRAEADRKPLLANPRRGTILARMKNLAGD